MPEALLGVLAALLPVLATVWGSGRQFRERRTLKEEMELYAAWAEQAGAAALKSHIERQLAGYLNRAESKERSFGELARRIALILIATWLATLVIATASGVLEPAQAISDPDLWFFVVMGFSAASLVWTIGSWVRSKRAVGA